MDLSRFYFVECETCKAKTGNPPLCQGCYNNRKVIAQLKGTIHMNRKNDHVRILNAINSKIASGPLGGDSTDDTAERNGLIMAYNIVAKMDYDEER